LFWVRKGLKPLLISAGLKPKLADVLAKAGPVVAIALTTLLAWSLDWQGQGMKLVGTVPQGLPPLTAPLWDLALWQELLVPALAHQRGGLCGVGVCGSNLGRQTPPKD
jgi:SulP family sulfate permease